MIGGLRGGLRGIRVGPLDRGPVQLFDQPAQHTLQHVAFGDAQLPQRQASGSGQQVSQVFTKFVARRYFRMTSAWPAALGWHEQGCEQGRDGDLVFVRHSNETR